MAMSKRERIDRMAVFLADQAGKRGRLSTTTMSNRARDIKVRPRLLLIELVSLLKRKGLSNEEIGARLELPKSESVKKLIGYARASEKRKRWWQARGLEERKRKSEGTSRTSRQMWANRSQEKINATKSKLSEKARKRFMMLSQDERNRIGLELSKSKKESMARWGEKEWRELRRKRSEGVRKHWESKRPDEIQEIGRSISQSKVQLPEELKPVYLETVEMIMGGANPKALLKILTKEHELSEPEARLVISKASKNVESRLRTKHGKGN